MRQTLAEMLRCGERLGGGGLLRGRAELHFVG